MQAHEIAVLALRPDGNGVLGRALHVADLASRLGVQECLPAHTEGLLAVARNKREQCLEHARILGARGDEHHTFEQAAFDVGAQNARQIAGGLDIVGIGLAGRTRPLHAVVVGLLELYQGSRRVMHHLGVVVRTSGTQRMGLGRGIVIQHVHDEPAPRCGVVDQQGLSQRHRLRGLRGRLHDDALVHGVVDAQLLKLEVVTGPRIRPQGPLMKEKRDGTEHGHERHDRQAAQARLEKAAGHEQADHNAGQHMHRQANEDQDIGHARHPAMTSKVRPAFSKRGLTTCSTPRFA